MLNADQVAQLANCQCTAPEVSEFPGAVKTGGVPVNVIVDMMLIDMGADNKGMIAFGEVGLTGEVRAVSQVSQRVAEAQKLGFTTCVLPKVSADSLKELKGIKIIGVASVQDAVDLI